MILIGRQEKLSPHFFWNKICIFLFIRLTISHTVFLLLLLQDFSILIVHSLFVTPPSPFFPFDWLQLSKALFIQECLDL